jgi:hypothetical protein
MIFIQVLAKECKSVFLLMDKISVLWFNLAPTLRIKHLQINNVNVFILRQFCARFWINLDKNEASRSRDFFKNLTIFKES